MNSEDLKYDGDINLEAVEEEGIVSLKSMLQKLYSIWNEVGIDNKQKEKRANVVWKHLLNLMQEIIEEENSMYENVLQCLKSYMKKIKELSEELCMPEDEEVSGNLIQKEKKLRIKLDNLTEIKQRRLKTYQDLHIVEVKCCKLLGLPTLKISSSTGVPNENDLYELKQHINMLEEEKKHRLQKFLRIKNELATIMEVTELSPETYVEEIITASGEEISLTNETFKILENTLHKLQNRKESLEKEKKSLVNKLTVIWKTLNVAQSERKLFLLKHSDCCVSTLTSMKQEVDRCEEIKRQNIKMYMLSLRQELLELWSKCYISEAERQQFQPSFSDECNDEILNALETEVEKWRKYYENTECIIKKIEKRQKLWDLMTLFENKANDPNRFKNRRGNLLQEERERKKLQKELPTLENEIFLDIENFETTTGNLFLYCGEDFRTFVTRQWERRIAQKEKEKHLKRKLHAIQVEHEVTFGTTPCKRPVSAAPKSAPSKLFKSAMGQSIYQTPSLRNCKAIPNTVGRLHFTNLQKNSQKSILRERNKKSELSSLNDTSYTDFKSKLSRPSRIGHCSSLLASRKIVGTRIPQNNRSKRKSTNKSISQNNRSKRKSANKSMSQNNRSKRKSANKSLRRSTRKKMDVSKITPARGKLPFLI